MVETENGGNGSSVSLSDVVDEGVKADEKENDREWEGDKEGESSGRAVCGVLGRGGIGVRGELAPEWLLFHEGDGGSR